MPKLDPDLRTYLAFDKLEPRIETILIQYCFDLVARHSAKLANDHKYPGLHFFQTNEIITPPSPTEISRVYAHIKTSRLIGACPAPALLSATAMSQSITNAQFECYKFWTLVAIADLYPDTEVKPHINTGCMQIRLLSDPKHNWLKPYLPTQLSSVHQIVQDLQLGYQQIRQTEHQPLGTEPKSRANIHNNISRLFRYHCDLVEKRERIKRKNNKKAIAPKEITLIKPDIGLIDEDYEYVQIESLPENNQDGCQLQERLYDQPRPKTYISFEKIKLNKGTELSTSLRHRQLKAVSNQIVRRQMRLPCDWHSLSTFEVGTVLTWCYQKLSHEPIMAILIVSILTGRTIRQVITLINHSCYCGVDLLELESEKIILWYKPEHPPHKNISKAAAFLKPADDKIDVSLPGNLYAALSSLRAQNKRPAEYTHFIQDVLNEIKVNTGFIRLSLIRLAAFKYQYLTQVGLDPAFCAILCGHTLNQATQIYYLAAYKKKLEEHHEKFLSTILDAAQHPFEKGLFHSRNRDNPLFGTQLFFDLLPLKLYFQLSNDELQSLKKSNKTKVFHNTFILTCLELLCLSTGHRPVTAPFETLMDFDLKRKIIWISDKEIRSGLAARQIPLPKLALDVVHNIQDHLKNLLAKGLLHQEEDIQAIRLALTGESFFLVYFDDKPRPLDPRILQKAMEKRWPFPLNWHRHLMRSMLTNAKIPGDHIDAWMGHENFGQEAFGRFSGLSTEDMRQISDAIDGWFRRIGIEAPEGCQ